LDTCYTEHLFLFFEFPDFAIRGVVVS